jgi:hypothetical protein
LNSKRTGKSFGFLKSGAWLYTLTLLKLGYRKEVNQDDDSSDQGKYGKTTGGIIKTIFIQPIDGSTE